jgi:glycosyltransferase involved in cell wall biosynthesis
MTDSSPTRRSDRKLHIALVTQNAALELDLRPRAEAAALAAAGYDVTLVGGTRDAARVRELADEALALELYPMPAEARNAAGQIVEQGHSLALLARALVRLGRRRRIDVVHASNPPDDVWLVLPLLRAVQRSKPRFVFDQHDVAPVLLAEKYGDRKVVGKLGAVASLLERRSFRRADLVVFANPEYDERARSLHLLRGRSAVVPNGWSLEGGEHSDEWRNGAGHVLAYVGAMSEQDCVSNLVDAVASLRTRDVLVWMAGDGAARAAAQRRADELGVGERFRWLGWVDGREKLGSLVRSADVCVSPETESEFNKLASFVKLVEYMSVGAPIAAHRLAQNVALCGDTVEYADDMTPRGLANAIGRLLDDRQRASSLGGAARARFRATIAWENVGAPHLVRAYDETFR